MEYMKTALLQAKKAMKKKEVPVGVVLISNNKIIAKAHNKRECKNDVLAHAEIIAIKKASKKMKTWKLNDVDMYVTLKPCSMCENVIKQSRIKNVYYLIEKEVSKKEFDKSNICLYNEELAYIEEYKKILSKFFKKIRK